LVEGFQNQENEAGWVSFWVIPYMERLRDFWGSRGEAKKPNQIGFREYIFPFYENPCRPWNEITADETFRESRP